MGIISVCDTDIINGKLEVVDQRDWNVPNFHMHDIEILCKYSKANENCDGDCDKCIITRII